MNVEIVSDSDDHFKINTVKFGSVHVASDGERSAIATSPELATKEVENMQEISKQVEPKKSNAAPLENSKEGHPFNPYGGTSWDDGKRGHKF